MNISGLSDRSDEEWKGRRSEGGGEGGPGNQIWFCRSHKWLKACRFQSGRPSLHQLRWFTPAALCVCLFLQAQDDPIKKKTSRYSWINPTLLLRIKALNSLSIDLHLKTDLNLQAGEQVFGLNDYIHVLLSFLLNWSVGTEISANRNSTQAGRKCEKL